MFEGLGKALTNSIHNPGAGAVLALDLLGGGLVTATGAAAGATAAGIAAGGEGPDPKAGTSFPKDTDVSETGSTGALPPKRFGQTTPGTGLQTPAGAAVGRFTIFDKFLLDTMTGRVWLFSGTEFVEVETRISGEAHAALEGKRNQLSSFLDGQIELAASSQEKFQLTQAKESIVNGSLKELLNRMKPR